MKFIGRTGFAPLTDALGRIHQSNLDREKAEQVEKLREAGKEFLTYGDYSAEGIQRFAQERGLGIELMQPLVQMVAQFKKLTPEPRMMKFSRTLDNGQVQQVEGPADQAQDFLDQGYQPGTLTAPQDRSTTRIKEWQQYNRGLPEGERIPFKDFMKLDPRGTNVTVNTQVLPEGNQALTKPTQNTVQKQAVYGVDMLDRLDKVWESFDPEWLTYLGKGKNVWNTTKEKLGFRTSPEEKEAITGMTNFRMNIEQLFNAYRREITGAAASVQELESLRKSMFNTDLSETEFKAAFNQFRDETKRSLRVKQKLLREGIPVGSPMFGQQLDAAFLGGEQANQPPDVNARGDEIANRLRAEGVPENEVQERVMERLEYEGYL